MRRTAPQLGFSMPVTLAAFALLFAVGCGQRPAPEAAAGMAGNASTSAKVPAPASAPTVAESPALASAQASAEPAASAAPASTATSTAAVAAPPAKIKRIVFLDKEECCNCTRDRQNKTWENMEAAVGSLPARPDIVKIHVDTQADEASPYLDLRPVMVTPGLFFFGQDDTLVDMLQGEVTREQMDSLLR